MLALGLTIVILAVVLSLFVGAYEKSRAEYNELSDKYSDAVGDAEEARADRNAVEAKIIYKEKIIEELQDKNKMLSSQLLRVTAPVPTPKKTEPFDVHTNVFRVMDYRTITDTGSAQYALQQLAMTRHNGIRAVLIDDRLYYCAALGGAFGYNIGSAYRIILRNGYGFNIILAEYKHALPRTPEEWEAAKNDWGDPDYSYLSPKNENGEYIKDSLNVIEFVVDETALPDKVRTSGTVTAIPAFGGLDTFYGDIVDIESLGAVWEG